MSPLLNVISPLLRHFLILIKMLFLSLETKHANFKSLCDLCNKLTNSLFRLSTHRQDDTQTTQATCNSGDRDALQFSSAPGELGARSEN